MSLTIPSTNLYRPLANAKPTSTHQKSILKPRSTILCSSSSPDPQPDFTKSALQAFSAALALSSILISAAPIPPASADIAGLTPCKDSKQFAKREKQQLKKLESSLSPSELFRMSLFYSPGMEFHRGEILMKMEFSDPRALYLQGRTSLTFSK
ncbi:hypothetical protein CsSME_00046606 [Camellia sinensis var. sinensis]